MKTFLSVIFSLVFCVFTKGQDAKSILDFAELNFKNKNYQQTIESCKRVAFFEKKYIPQTDWLIAESFFMLQDWENASNNYERAYFTQQNDSLKAEIILKKSLCFIFLEKYLHAKNELYNINNQSGRYFTQKRDLYLGIVHINLEEYQLAKNVLESVFDNENDIKIGIKKLKKAERINPKLAVFSSAVIPGMGQIINHEYKDGLNSFAINALFAGLFIYTGINYSLVDGFISIFPWFQRYYMGGIKNAKNAALKRQKYNRNESIVYFISMYEKAQKQ